MLGETAVACPLRLAAENVRKVCWILGDFPTPMAETGLIIDSLNPFIKETPLDLVLLAVLSLDL
jgi:hypothetical protein